MRVLAVATALAVGGALAATTAFGHSTRLGPRSHGAECTDSQFPATRDPSNPLLLPNAPGANPLNGANFFVDGPRHGMAAGAIARLLGMNPDNFSDDESWADFDGRIVPLALLTHPRAAHDVHLLEKIAREPEPQRFSIYSAGGGPGAIYGQVYKIFCSNLTADPGSVPIMQTLFIYPHGKYCASKGEIVANEPTFKRQVNEAVRGTGRRPAVWLLELDSVATSSCLSRGARAVWESELQYEIDQFASLPHTVVYVEGGYSDANGPRYTAKVLNKIDIGRIRGFYTNDTHEAWTINEIKWGQKVSSMTHGADFVVNTAQNGRGPKLNPHPVRQGIEDLCNPPGRGIGPIPTADTGFDHVDAFMWTYTPGKSSGHCHGGPASGLFWPKRAIELASRANQQLGPGYPSRPY
jgi:endoglucanase